MITDRSIEEVKEKADLLEVIQERVTLKKFGANFLGLCPFHEDKKPSFTVSPAKGVYKCFVCGTGGRDPIRFLMDMENIDFPAAVRYLADKYQIQLEETKTDEEPDEQRLKRVDYIKINKAAARRYQELLFELPDTDEVKKELLINRQLTQETIIDFQLGFAPNKDNYITQLVMTRNLYQPAIDIGLIKTSDTEERGLRTYDMFQNRIIFPILNERGEPIAFGGRTMEKGDKVKAKYINSPGSLIYQKDKVLFGLYHAAKAIREMKFAVLVEGYFDVISFHQAGMENTIAPCGTAFTDGQAKILKRHTNHIILVNDSDEAGEKANLKSVDVLLRHNFKVEICDLPKGEDPDSFARAIMNPPPAKEKKAKKSKVPAAPPVEEALIEEGEEGPF